jgi:hypothetical protein
MPRLRNRFLFPFVLVLVAGLVTGLWLLWPRTAITLENAAQIREGMTKQEVEAILGGPPRNETTGPVTVEPADATALLQFAVAEPVHGIKLLDEQADPPSLRTWRSNQALVCVALDPGERVLRFVAIPLRRVDETLLDMLRRWLRI